MEPWLELLLAKAESAQVMPHYLCPIESCPDGDRWLVLWGQEVLATDNTLTLVSSQSLEASFPVPD